MSAGCFFTAIILITQQAPRAWPVDTDGEALLHCTHTWSATDDRQLRALRPLLLDFYHNQTLDLRQEYAENGSCTCLRPVEFYANVLSVAKQHQWSMMCLDKGWSLTMCPGEHGRLFGKSETYRPGMGWLRHWRSGSGVTV